MTTDMKIDPIIRSSTSYQKGFDMGVDIFKQYVAENPLSSKEDYQLFLFGIGKSAVKLADIVENHHE